MKFVNNSLVFIFLIVVILAEMLASHWILSAPIFKKGAGAALHLVLVLLFGFVMTRIKSEKFNIEKNLLLLAFVFSFVLPVYGMIGMVVIYVCMCAVNMKPIEYHELDEDLLSEKHDYFPQESDRSIIAIKREELDIEAFEDIFRTHDRQMEEVAINKLSKIANKQAVSILKNVIKECPSDTSVLAASALIDVEDKLIKEIESRKSQLDEHPENDSAYLELARAYDLYCHLGIQDRMVTRYYQDLALQQYRRYLNLRPDDPDANLECGRVLLNSGEYHEAISVLKKTIALAPQELSPRMWLAEAYYELTDYQNVAQVCQGLAEIENLPPKFKEIVSWWALDQPWSKN